MVPPSLALRRTPSGAPPRRRATMETNVKRSRWLRRGTPGSSLAGTNPGEGSHEVKTSRGSEEPGEASPPRLLPRPSEEGRGISPFGSQGTPSEEGLQRLTGKDNAKGLREAPRQRHPVGATWRNPAGEDPGRLLRGDDRVREAPGPYLRGGHLRGRAPRKGRSRQRRRGRSSEEDHLRQQRQQRGSR